MIQITNEIQFHEFFKDGTTNYLFALKNRSDLNIVDSFFEELDNVFYTENKQVLNKAMSSASKFGKIYKFRGLNNIAEMDILSPRDQILAFVRGKRVLQKASKAGYNQINVYYSRTCPWCKKLFNYLDRRNITFTKIILSSPGKIEALFKKTGHQTIPQMEIDGKFYGGYDESKLSELFGDKC